MSVILNSWRKKPKGLYYSRLLNFYSDQPPNHSILTQYNFTFCSHHNPMFDNWGAQFHRTNHGPPDFWSRGFTILLTLKVLSFKPADEGKKKAEKKQSDDHTWQLLWTIPRSGTCHFGSHSIGQNSIEQPYLENAVLPHAWGDENKDVDEPGHTFLSREP